MMPAGYTPMGQMYKDHESPIGYQQIILAREWILPPSIL